MVAYDMQGQWLYDVGFWEGTGWSGRGVPGMWGYKPQMFHKIKSPNEFFTELEKQAEDYQRGHITGTDRKDENEVGHFPFLGTN